MPISDIDNGLQLYQCSGTHDFVKVILTAHDLQKQGIHLSALKISTLKYGSKGHNFFTEVMLNAIKKYDLYYDEMSPMMIETMEMPREEAILMITRPTSWRVSSTLYLPAYCAD